MKLPIPLALLAATSIHIVYAIPYFHISNNLYLNKTVQCVEPSIDKPCPNLCVPLKHRNALCPTNCKTGEVLCNDGKCYKDKKSCDLPTLVNPCNCGGDVDSGFVPCKTPTVYVPAYLPVAKLADRCIADIKSSITGEAFSMFECKNIPILGQQANADIAIGWVLDPTVLAKKNFTGMEPFYVAFYAISGLEAVLLVAWFMYKYFSERSVRTFKPFLLNEKTGLSDSASYVDEVIPKTEKLDGIVADSKKREADDINIQAYSSSLFGTFVLGSVILFSVFLQLSLLLIVLDYYGKLSGVPMAVFGLTLVIPHETNFVIVWHVATIWLVTLQFSGKRLRNNFRIKSSQKVCDFVQVAQERDGILVVRDSGRLLRWMRKLENCGKNVTGGDITFTTVPIKKTSDGLKYFEFQCTRFVYDASIDRFDPFEFKVIGSTQADILAFRGGLKNQESIRRRQLMGPNFVSVFVPSFLLAMGQELTGIFYLYQLMSLWVWYYFAYYLIGLIQTSVILISAVIRVVLRLRSELRIKKMAEFEREVQILRDGKWVKSSSADLVPGDVFEIRENENVPCDAAIISGNIVVDESSVTGEPLPIRKRPIANDASIVYDKHSGKMNTLFDGTKVLQINPPTLSSDPAHRLPGNGDGKATAVVVSTGTATDKGQLIHNILYPQAVSFIFNAHLKIIIFILLIWAIIVFLMCIWLIGATDITAWFYGLYKFANILSPLIPVALVLGQSVASNRLRLKKIFCIDLSRIMIAGKVRIFCFDKTGTLTRDGLEWEGFQSINAGGDPTFGNTDANTTALPEIVRMGISTCHAVVDVNGQLVGNPVDIEQFRSSKVTICSEQIENVLDVIQPTHSPNASPYHVIKRFEFIHARMSMSVVVQNTHTNHVHVFVKGSFEKVKDIALPESIPADYDDVASGHARKGCYTLALAHRDLGEIDRATVRTWTREQCEQDIRMAGLIMFKNKLKDDSKEAIMDLKEGGCRPVMITGDNILTGICIGRNCGMIPPANRIVLADIETLEGSSSKELTWRDYDTNEKIDDLRPLLSDAQFNPIELAVTGKAFNCLVKEDTIKDLLLDIRVYARMTPTDKVDCVKLLMERGITAMCGDGGNDCGALRAAHVGVALSEAEASIVSPFSSSTRSIQSCVELLRQGRAALATSFAAYKFLIIYGEIMASLSLIQYYFGVVASQPMWILFDVMTVFLTGALTLGKPAARLSSKRPTARLIGTETLASALGHIFINMSFLCGAIVLLFQQEFFVCSEFNAESVAKEKWWQLGDNFEAAVIGLVSVVQFINGAMPFSFGYKFRAAWYKNYVVVAMYSIMMVFASFLFLAPPNPMSCIFRINCGSVDYMAKNGVSWASTWLTDPGFDIQDYNAPIQNNIFPVYFRWTLWFYCIANCLVSNFYERFVMLGPVRKYFMKTRPQDRLTLKL